MTTSLSTVVSGAGPTLVLLHGWPFHRATWRHVLPVLERHFTCLCLDLAGAGDSTWDEHTSFHPAAQARLVRDELDRRDVRRYALMAHDTGATIARLVAAGDAERVVACVFTNTEIPGHRPPFIPTFQRGAALPLARKAFGQLLRWRWFRDSPAGFGGCYDDRDRIERELVPLFVEPLLRTPRRLEGQLRYLRGIDWRVVDGLSAVHHDIRAPTRLVWGADDETFPLERARLMTRQFGGGADLVAVTAARFLVHDERPAEVCAAAIPFLSDAFERDPAASA